MSYVCGNYDERHLSGGIPPQPMSVHIPTTSNAMTSQSSMISGQQSGQGQGQDNFNNGNGYTNRVTYGMTSSVGALGVQPHRSLTSMTSNGAGKGQGLAGVSAAVHEVRLFLFFFYVKI